MSKSNNLGRKLLNFAFPISLFLIRVYSYPG
jgi:hypothetical protein